MKDYIENMVENHLLSWYWYGNSMDDDLEPTEFNNFVIRQSARIRIGYTSDLALISFRPLLNKVDEWPDEIRADSWLGMANMPDGTYESFRARLTEEERVAMQLSGEEDFNTYCYNNRILSTYK